MSDASAHEPGGECRSCPVCLLLQALQELRPDARAHLVAAGQQLVLALRAALAPESAPDGGRGVSAEREDAGAWAGGASGRSESRGVSAEREDAGAWAGGASGRSESRGAPAEREDEDNERDRPSDVTCDTAPRRLRRIDIQ